MNKNDGTKRLRVLHQTGTLNCGGAETRLMELLRISKKANIHFDFCVSKDEEYYYEAEAKSLGSQVLRCKSPRILPLFAWRFYRILKRHKYDIVHCHILLFSGICLAIARLAGVKKRIVHMRNTPDNTRDPFFRRIYNKLMINLILKNATDIIGISNDVLRIWFGKDWRKNSKIRLIYNGLNTAPFHCASEPDWLKREFDIPSGYKTVVHVGRLTRQKNHVKLISIAQCYLADHPETCFILAGRGKLRSKIEDSINAKGLASKFRFVGVRSDVPRIMMGADAFLFPSAWEGLGGVVIEAIAAGLPMVVSDLPAFREIFDICGRGEILSLDAPDIKWSTALDRTVKTPRQNQWLGELENSDLSLDSAWQNLLSVYRGE